jgi:inosine-uridine nucleoside N-ribohydrolase
MNTRRPFIILTDAASFGDDGVAIAMILANAHIDTRLIVCTSGNVWADEVADNVRRLLSRLGRTEIPVCVSMPGPAQLHRAQALQTQTQQERISYAGALSKPFPSSESSHPECKEFNEIVAREHGVNLLVLAPPTPIAALQHENPGLLARLGAVFVMGGALNVAGNATPFAEFNFWFDPKAADTLFSADLDITVFPQDVANRLSYPADIAENQQPASPGLAYLREYLIYRESRSKTPLGIWDEALSAIVLRPDLVESTLSLEAHVVTHGIRAGKFEPVKKSRR